MLKTINDVRQFWENNPLWTGESDYEPGTKEFFEEHRRVIYEDGYAGTLDSRFFPDNVKTKRVLDLGCGPGFWTVEFGLRGYSHITAADLTRNALVLAQNRCEVYDIKADFSQQNAEQLAFKDGIFAHVNCQGVIHHTPNTEGCVQEIARVLERGGTASISVYYQNIFLRAWPFFKWVGKLSVKIGIGLKGRGRENICMVDNVDEIVRLYDGQENPIGKLYTRQQFIQMVSPFFDIQELYLHFFPARAFPFKLPRIIHQFFDRHAGFLIYATLKKR